MTPVKVLYSEHHMCYFLKKANAEYVFCEDRNCLNSCAVYSECIKQFVFRPGISEGEMKTLRKPHPELFV